MIPYYFDLGRRIISDEISSTLIDLFHAYREDFVQYKTHSGRVHDGNNFIRGHHLKNNLKIQDLIDSVLLPCYPVLMMHQPNTEISRHVDDPNKRNSIIITPLLPESGFPPTRFYQNDSLIAECNFEKNNSYLVNTQVYHDLKTNDEYRLNFQLSFNESFDKVLDLFLKNQLFKI